MRNGNKFWNKYIVSSDAHVHVFTKIVPFDTNGQVKLSGTKVEKTLITVLIIVCLCKCFNAFYSMRSLRCYIFITCTIFMKNMV